MRRSEITDAVNQLQTALRETGIIDVIGLREGPGSAEGIARTLDAMAQWRVASADFTDATKQLLDIFELRPLNTTQFWTSHLTGSGEKQDRGEVVRVRRALMFCTEYLPKVVSLLEQSALHEAHILKEREPSFAFDLLTLIVIEEKDQKSSPARIVQAIECISEMYSVLSELQNQPSNDLALVACDSGSDKSFDFLGLAKLIEGSKEIIFGLFDRVVFYREQRATVQFRAIAESLPIIGRIEELRVAGSLEPEQALLLKERVVKASVGLLEVGAVIPEIYARVHHEPRLLMAPQPKLLAGPSAVSEVSQGQESDKPSQDSPQDVEVEAQITEVIAELSPEQKDRLLKALQRGKETRKGHPRQKRKSSKGDPS